MNDLFFESDDSDFSESEPYDAYLTVLGLLQTHYGPEQGADIYNLLHSAAKTTAAVIEDVPTCPGILFTGEGGEFVGFEQDDEESLSEDWEQ